MNGISLLLRILSIAVFAFQINYGNTQTYQTIGSGDWSDGSLWSTDGGVSPCGCTPASPSVGADIYVNHEMNMTSHVTINGGSYLNVNSNGAMVESTSSTLFNIVARGSATVLDIHGQLNINKLINGASGAGGSDGGTINIYFPSITTINGRFQNYDHTVNLYGSFFYIPAGNFDNYPNGVFNLYQGANVELYGGNINNEGNLYICDSCCVETLGNWSNEVTGTVTGSGSAQTTGGNMSNSAGPGAFSLDIRWCSVGFDAGMPSTEDCTNAQNTCNGMGLPVVLAKFNVIHRGSYNEVAWMTASERNSDYFIVLRSDDGYNWKEIAELPAEGNSETDVYYLHNDYDFDNTQSTSYYKLEQYDLNGEFTKSQIVSVYMKSESQNLIIYPNPIKAGDLLRISGLSNNDQTILIVGNSGRFTQNKLVCPTDHYIDIHTDSLQPGLYNIQVIDESGYLKRARFVVK